MKKKINSDPNISAFLGIGEGKRKKAKAEAQAALLKAQTEAEEKLLAAKVSASQSGYKSPEILNAESDLITSQSSNTLYYILGLVVVAIMIGLYFIKRHRL